MNRIFSMLASLVSPLVIAGCLAFLPTNAAAQAVTLGPPSRIPLGVAAGRTIFAGDFNGDGSLDLLPSGPSNYSVLFGKPDGTFTPAKIVADQVLFGTTLLSAVADMDGDGKADVWQMNNCNILFISRSLGDGTFAPFVRFSPPPAEFTCSNALYAFSFSLKTADLNGDGKLDAIAGNFYMLNKGNLTFADAVPLHGGPLLDRNIFQTHVADLNRDGKPDLVTSLKTGGAEVALGNGDGTFLPPVKISDISPNAMEVADINGDGIMDIALFPPTGRPAQILFGRGNGTFQPAVNSTVAAGVLTDMNLDGRSDLVIASAGRVSILTSNGDGSFENAATLTPLRDGSTPVFMVADLNRDRKPDLMVFDLGTNELVTYLNSTPPPPAINSVNTAGNGSVIAQNTWIEIKGRNLVPANTPAEGVIWNSAPEFAAGRMPTALRDVSVTVNGKAAFVYFYCSAATSPACAQDQINVLTPLDSTVGRVPLVVKNGSASSAPFQVEVKTVAPSLLLFSSKGYVVATHSDYSLLGPATLFPGLSRPGRANESVILYGVGFGLPSSNLVAGSSSQAGALPVSPVCKIDGVPVDLAFAGLVSPGLYQLNATLPAGLPSGDHAIVCEYGGAATPSTNLITLE